METLAPSQELVLEEEQQIALQDKLETLEKRTRELDESIRYAGMLQESILPNDLIFKNNFKDAFVYYQPKDVIGGDFYWIYLHGNDIYFAVGDCTGHGVPGALINIAGNSILRQIIRLEGVSSPSTIVKMLDQELVSMFNENLTNGSTNDGMEIALCKFNLATGKGEFCGAGRPLLLMRENELVEFKKNSFSVGFQGGVEKKFETIEFQLFKGDRFYMFSDGYTDQFGGDNIKKFNRKRFRKLIQSIHEYPMNQQLNELRFTYNSWMGNQEQIDDVCVIGIEI